MSKRLSFKTLKIVTVNGNPKLFYTICKTDYNSYNTYVQRN